jgi:hypothetical protein
MTPQMADFYLENSIRVEVGMGMQGEKGLEIYNERCWGKACKRWMAFVGVEIYGLWESDGNRMSDAHSPIMEKRSKNGMGKCVFPKVPYSKAKIIVK